MSEGVDEPPSPADYHAASVPGAGSPGVADRALAERETPVVAVFTDRDREFRAVVDSLVGAECRPCPTWTAFERAFPCADLGVVALPRLDRSEYASLGALRAAHPLVPVVLITRRDPNNVPHPGMVEDIVYLHAIQQDLPRAARGALEARCLARAARAIEALPVPDPELLATLARACRMPVPPRTVVALAAVGGWDRRTLYLHWQKAFPASRSPHDFLQWLLLMHAVRLRLRHRSWMAVARALRADRRTLEASAINLVGVWLDDTAELRCEDWLGTLFDLLGTG